MDLLKFVSTALLLSLAWTLAPLETRADDSLASPFDGMSAIEIMVAAALEKKASSPTASLSNTETPNGAVLGLDFLACDLVEIKGRDLHEGEFPIPGNPLPGEATALVEFTGFAQSAQFRLVDVAGTPLENISLSPPSEQTASSTYLGNFTVPTQPFRIAAIGLDVSDQAFDITCERLYSPQTVTVRFDAENNIVQAGLNELPALITNHGPANTFLINAVTDLGITANTDLAEIALGEDESQFFTVRLVVPDISSGVLDIVVTATATAESEPSLFNQANSFLRIERFEQLFWDNFE